jgi:hypothetical protein
MPEPAAAAALAAARTALRQVAVELRQLDDDRRHAFRNLVPRVREERFSVVSTVAMTATSLLLATAWLHVNLDLKHVRPLELAPTLAGTLGVLAFGLIRIADLYRRLSELSEPWVAHVPSAPGEPARCHVCGAPVPIESTQAVARCAYCGADNLVDPMLLARIRSRHHLVVDGLEETVVAEATALSDVSFDVDRWSLAVRLSLPAIAPLAVWLCFQMVEGYEGPFDRSVPYRREYDGCFVQDSTSNGDTFVDPGQLVGGMALGAPRELFGTETESGGRIIELSGNPIFGNRARVFEAGREEVLIFREICPPRR